MSMFPGKTKLTLAAVLSMRTAEKEKIVSEQAFYRKPNPSPWCRMLSRNP